MSTRPANANSINRSLNRLCKVNPRRHRPRDRVKNTAKQNCMRKPPPLDATHQDTAGAIPLEGSAEMNQILADLAEAVESHEAPSANIQGKPGYLAHYTDI